jgi:hypothetical protein
MRYKASLLRRSKTQNFESLAGNYEEEEEEDDDDDVMIMMMMKLFLN